MLLGWVFPPNFEMEILISPAGAPKRGNGLEQQHPVGAKVGGSTHLLDGGVGVLMGSWGGPAPSGT